MSNSPSEMNRLSRAKSGKLYPLVLTEEQRTSMIHFTRIKPRIRNILKEMGGGSHAVGASKQDLEHVSHELAEAALRADAPDKQNLVQVLHEIQDLLTEIETAHSKNTETGVSLKAPETGDLVYQFKITLLKIAPPIWRRIQVSDCKLPKLHDCIQAAFGWEDYHLHQFEIDGECYGPSFEDDLAIDADVRDESRLRLSKVVPKSGRKSRWIYEYDFGDGWRHEILFEGFARPDPKAKVPRCVAGARACPPEDSGGPLGYPYLLNSLNDPKCERYEWLMEVHGPFDPEAFDAQAATREMRKVK